MYSHVIIRMGLGVSHGFLYFLHTWGIIQYIKGIHHQSELMISFGWSFTVQKVRYT